jgi:hypothetical protein
MPVRQARTAIYFIAILFKVLLAQAAHTQASPRAAAGIFSIRVASNLTPLHQQGGCATPVSFSTSIAQKLAWPHKGHCVALAVSIGVLPGGGAGRLM